MEQSLRVELLDRIGNETGFDMVATDDGNFVIAGRTWAQPNQFETIHDIIMTKIDIDGNVIWMNIIDMDRYEHALSIAESMDGGFILSGFIDDNDDYSGYPFIMKTDNRGDLIWVDVQQVAPIGIQSHVNVIAHDDRTSTAFRLAPFSRLRC